MLCFVNCAIECDIHQLSRGKLRFTVLMGQSKVIFVAFSGHKDEKALLAR